MVDLHKVNHPPSLYSVVQHVLVKPTANDQNLKRGRKVNQRRAESGEYYKYIKLHFSQIFKVSQVLNQMLFLLFDN